MPKRHIIWDKCFIIGPKESGKRYFPATCKFCGVTWKHGKLDEALKHAGLNCTQTPREFKEIASLDLDSIYFFVCVIIGYL